LTRILNQIGGISLCSFLDLEGGKGFDIFTLHKYLENASYMRAHGIPSPLKHG
jgi:hypothetical protein